MLYFKVDTEAEAILEIANRPIALDEDAPDSFTVLEQDAPNSQLDVRAWDYEDGELHPAEETETEDKPSVRSRIFGTKNK